MLKMSEESKRKFYMADAYGEKDGTFQSVGRFVVLPTFGDRYIEVLTGKKIGSFSKEGEPRMSLGTSTSKYNKDFRIKKGKEYPTIYVDKGSLTKIEPRSIKYISEELYKKDKNKFEMYLLRTMILNGQVPKKKKFYNVTVYSFAPGYTETGYGMLDRSVIGKANYIVMDSKNGYREILTGQEFGYFGLISGWSLLDDMPCTGYGFHPTEEHPSMFVDDDDKKLIEQKDLQACFINYCNKFKVETLDEELKKPEKTYKLVNKTCTSESSVETDEK